MAGRDRSGEQNQRDGLMSTAVRDRVWPARDGTLDVVRGLIVALMALDHVRIFFTSATFDPTDVAATDWGYFLTRGVTHLCAPGFFFIAGAGAWLMERAGMPRAALARFLAVRGLWLIAVELLVFGFAWSFRPGWMWFGVIWGLGAAFILLAACVGLPKRGLLGLACAFVPLQPLLVGRSLPTPALDALFVSGGVVELAGIGTRLVLYPVLPWAALMLAGFASAPLWLRAGRPAAARLLVAGGVMIAAFVLLRAIGIGGGAAEPFAGAKAVMSFINIRKYPPSLQFSLATLGLLALCAGAVAWRSIREVPRLLQPLRDFGRVPFFFYAVHLFLIHGLALLAAAVLGWPLDYLFWSGSWPNLQPPPGYGVGLAGVFAVWLLVLALLWPACRWFGGLKRRHPSFLMRLL